MNPANISGERALSFGINRREALKRIGAAAALANVAAVALPAEKAKKKKIVVAGGGIGGMCCGFELAKRGHDVTVLEASHRAGGHVRSVHDPFPDGLYADLGAEQCTKPGYEIWRQYAKDFGLTLVPYRRRDNFVRHIGGKRYTEEELRSEKVLSSFAFNQREIEFLKKNDWSELPVFFYSKHYEKFKNEYEPFGIGLDELDEISVREHLKREGASEGALRFLGNDHSSALHALWHAAILNFRKVPQFPRELFRVQNGNQNMTDAFAKRLGDRLRLSCPISEIEQNSSGVKVRFKEFDEEKTIEADYLVNAIPLPVLNRIKVTPDWSAERRWIIENIHYNMQTRIVFQTRTRFWKKENQSINMSVGDPSLYDVWESADEVKTERGILLGSARPGTTPQQALDALKKFYTGKEVEVENVITQDWFRDPWAPLCERELFAVGQLKKFWPKIIQPEGRIHFVGAYADNLDWGMEAATRSANRVAKVLDEI